uniref:Uncharacterized protein n=1 Tax=Noctiluca scintillans TaxID=2966 RepID=A0A7S1APS3_NOCSC
MSTPGNDTGTQRDRSERRSHKHRHREKHFHGSNLEEVGWTEYSVNRVLELFQGRTCCCSQRGKVDSKHNRPHSSHRKHRRSTDGDPETSEVPARRRKSSLCAAGDKGRREGRVAFDDDDDMLRSALYVPHPPTAEGSSS